MNDEVARILNEFEFGRLVTPDLDPDVQIAEEDFDEPGYLRLNPDVAEAVRRGDVQSGYYHYIGYGYREGRSVPRLASRATQSPDHIKNAATGCALGWSATVFQHRSPDPLAPRWDDGHWLDQ